MHKRLTTFEDFLADHTFGGSEDRPFNGQAHTFAGERGKKPVMFLRLRDLADVVVRAWADQSAAAAAVGSANVDPDALAQAVCVLAEQKMQ